MRVLSVAFCCFLLAGFLLAGFLPVAAQTTIHRCVAKNGDLVFTDQPCAAMQATPLAPPAPAAPVDAVRAPVTLCAADGSELKRVVSEAFAARDANRLAGVMWWGGYGRGAVVADIRALYQLMREPLLDVATEPAPDAGPVAPGTSLPADAGTAMVPEALVLQTAGSDTLGGSHTLRFSVMRRAGCLWLRSAG